MRRIQELDYTGFDQTGSTLRGAESLSDLRFRTASLVAAAAQSNPPLLAFVEEPSGTFRNRALESAYGVILEATYSTLHDITGHAVLVGSVSSPTWKKAMTGHGNRKPPDYLADAQKRFRRQLEHNPDVAAAIWIAEWTKTLEIR